ncbi:MAG TPA: signal peptidase II [Myxococcales bacterium]|jgi:signal peptidase II
MRRKYGLLVAVFSLVVLTDQGTKYLAVASLTNAFEHADRRTFAERVAGYLTLKNLDNDPASPGGVDHRKPPVVVVASYWQHKYVENPGAAWGLLARVSETWRRPFFHVVSLIALVVILGFYRRLQSDQALMAVALSLILGGAMGNYFDRVIHGYVIDFVDWHWRHQPGLHWPTFNVADSAIVVGVLLLLAETMFPKRLAGREALAQVGTPVAGTDPEPPKPDSLAPPVETPQVPPPPSPGEGP